MTRKVTAALFLLSVSIAGCHEVSPGGPCREVDCSGHGDCLDVEGAAVCRCDEGFHADDDGRGCLLDDCEPGFERVGLECLDVDECSEGSHDCGPEDRARCLDEEGGFDCECLPGFEGDGRRCDDVDECREGEDACDPDHALCENSEGGYRCRCLEGFIDVTGDGRRCECPEGESPCSGRCVDLEADVEHCGGCGEACSLDNASASCVEGGCVVEGCREGYSDCDGLDETGCERIGPCPGWVLGFGAGGSDSAAAVAVDDAGNVYAVGSFNGTIDLGGEPLSSAGGQDAFVASFDASGEHRWSLRFGGEGDDAAASIAVDGGSGVTFVTGFFEESVSLGEERLSSAGQRDLLVASFTGEGDHRWARGFGGASEDYGNGLALDEVGDPIVTGYFEGALDLGDGELVSAGYWDIFLAAFSSEEGALRWSRRIGGAQHDAAYSVAIDDEGVLYLTGGFQHVVDFGGGGVAEETLTSWGELDVFLASYSPEGALRWVRRAGNSYQDSSACVAVGAGLVAITGYFRGSADFGGGWLTSEGERDLFLAVYDTEGGHRWSERFGGPEQEAGYWVALDEAGDLYITGEYGGTVSFGGEPLESSGGGEAFLASFTAEGEHRWSNSFGGPGRDIGYSIAVDGAGRAVSMGCFQETADFGLERLTSAGSYDVFLLKL